MKNDVINLITIVSVQDADGFPISKESSYICFADVQSVKGVEFYSAANVGMKVSLVAVVNLLDYKNAYEETKRPSIVDYEGIRHKITRTYMKKETDEIELTLTEVE